MGDLYKQTQWFGLQTIIRVVRTRHLWNKTTTEVMFYLSSLPPDAQQLGKVIRQHWSTLEPAPLGIRCDFWGRCEPYPHRLCARKCRFAEALEHQPT